MTKSMVLFYKMLSAHKDYVRAESFLRDYAEAEEGEDKLHKAKVKFEAARKRYLESLKESK